MNTAEEQAQVFLSAATRLGEALDTLEAILRGQPDALKDEMLAADKVCRDASELAYCLRTLAMRLDRSAYLVQS